MALLAGGTWVFTRTFLRPNVEARERTSRIALANICDHRSGVRMSMAIALNIRDVAQLEEALSQPSQADIDFMSRLRGDVMVLGAGGKMGPSLAKLTRRATVEADVFREVFAVSRFSSQTVRDDLEAAGVRTLSCDLMNPGAVDSLPACL